MNVLLQYFDIKWSSNAFQSTHILHQGAVANQNNKKKLLSHYNKCGIRPMANPNQIPTKRSTFSVGLLKETVPIHVSRPQISRSLYVLFVQTYEFTFCCFVVVVYIIKVTVFSYARFAPNVVQHDPVEITRFSGEPLQSLLVVPGSTRDRKQEKHLRFVKGNSSSQ